MLAARPSAVRARAIDAGGVAPCALARRRPARAALAAAGAGARSSSAASSTATAAAAAVAATLTSPSPRLGCHHRPSRRHPTVTRNSGYSYDTSTSSIDEAAQEQSDVTAALLEGAIKLALRSRLASLGGVDARVLSDARALLKGKFGGLRVTGLGWRTPLELTARVLEVEVGEVRVDLADLVWRRRLQLRNTPVGRTSFLLTPGDLGRFTQHPVFLKAAARCVDGAAFEFEPGSVRIVPPEGNVAAAAGTGRVMMEGRWVGDGERYRVVMVPFATAKTGGAAEAAAPAAAAAQPPKLQVGAQHLPRSGQPPNAAGAAAVARGLADFFTSLAIDLQGVELERPRLAVVPPSVRLAPEAWNGHSGGAGAVEEGGGGGGGNGGSGGSTEEEEALLEIGMSVRIREFPPLNLQF